MGDSGEPDPDMSDLLPPEPAAAARAEAPSPPEVSAAATAPASGPAAGPASGAGAPPTLPQPPAITHTDPFARFHGFNVVIDTRSNFVYIGKVVRSDSWFVELEEVDVHDRSEAHSTNEKYVMEAKKYGVKVNRRAVVVVKEQVVGISRLQDVVEY
ncbi:MAG: hypothetical protein HYZ53_25765 [Planctomycetes bacterium]|nr:hypothetical protein [Planctomycetota bacterium]